MARRRGLARFLLPSISISEPSTKQGALRGGSRDEEPTRMPRNMNHGLSFLLGILLAFYLLVPFLERAVR
jgi:hypothetical protein